MINYADISPEYLQELYPRFDLPSLQFIQEIDNKVAHLHRAGIPLDHMCYMLGLEFLPERVKASYKKQGFNRVVQTRVSNYDKIEQCNLEGLTAQETAVKLRLSLKVVKYNYPFEWPPNKTHNSDGTPLN